MLILSRHEGETVVITIPEGFSGRMVVSVQEFRRSTGKQSVRLGFLADEAVIIHRGEVQSRIDSGERLGGGYAQ